MDIIDYFKKMAFDLGTISEELAVVIEEENKTMTSEEKNDKGSKLMTSMTRIYKNETELRKAQELKKNHPRVARILDAANDLWGR